MYRINNTNNWGHPSQHFSLSKPYKTHPVWLTWIFMNFCVQVSLQFHYYNNKLHLLHKQGISLTGLIPPHCCTCLLWSFFFQWVTVIVCFIDIGGIGDHHWHCLVFLFKITIYSGTHLFKVSLLDGPTYHIFWHTLHLRHQSPSSNVLYQYHQMMGYMTSHLIIHKIQCNHIYVRNIRLWLVYGV